MNKNKKLNNIIEALSRHEDASAIDVLKNVGTNCHDDEIRRLTSKALVNRNTEDSLMIVMTEKGKGIHDLSTSVAMGTINEILSLEDKTYAIKILDEVSEVHEDEEIRETARSVKALMALS